MLPRVFKFLNPTVGHRGQVLSRLLCQLSIGSDSSILQVHARLNSFQEAEAWGHLRHWWNRIMRWTHLGKNFIQPLEGTVQMYLNPAGGASNILAVVFCSPALEKTQQGSFNLFNSVINLLSKRSSPNQRLWLKQQTVPRRMHNTRDLAGKLREWCWPPEIHPWTPG